MNRRNPLTVVFLIALVPTVGQFAGSQTPASAAYSLLAWSELGMHCMDGKDYSVFGVLPPYNTINAQLIKRGSTPTLVSTGVTVTYQALADASGSINTSSAKKTNFWQYVSPLFHSNVQPEIGLANYHSQGTAAQPMSYNATLGHWEAVGIPTIPYDDQGNRNPYVMVRLTARNSANTVLATADLVVPVSDEMTCSNCHASTSNNNATRPASGWENNPDPAKDVKFNILKKHDDRWDITKVLPLVQASGYNYQASLYQTAKSGTPILCAACHGSNALNLAGVAGVRQLTVDMHTLHATAADPATGVILDQATSPLHSCYMCHPGPQTKCQRGAMSGIACYDCHGNLSTLGSSTRTGWLDLPACQMCHTNNQRFNTTFDTPNHWRVASDLTFATNPDKPFAGKSLFRNSTGHGNVYCAACHGSTHAEFPTSQANDNVYSQKLQGYPGRVTECNVCHTSVRGMGGPHGMHPVGSSWVSSHGDQAGGNTAACQYCHGQDYRGTFLSVAKVARTLASKKFAAGHQFNCYDCHNGPRGGD